MAGVGRPPIDQHITFVYTRDGAAAWRFYGEVLGLELVLDQGACRIYRAVGAAYIGVCQCAEPKPAGGVILTIVTDAVEAWAARLRAHGVELVKGPVDNPAYRIHHLFAKDPDGHLIEVQRFWDPDWHRAG
jgi:catechol 2,3-dioxygenase-like lactoylglutathione lyase family enzyme